MNTYKNEEDKLVTEMGFNRVEASMALQETGGDVNRAVESLLAGKFSPPPYDPQETSTTASASNHHILEKNRVDDPNQPTFTNFLADLRGKHKAPMVEDHPSAPSYSFSDLSRDLNQVQIQLPDNAKQMPPPYEIVNKSEKVKAWEKDSNVFYYDKQSAPTGASSQYKLPDFIATGERCDTCFNILQDVEDVLSQGRKIYHGICFRKKFGPKCAHCCFPLSLPDKDHDLSGKYLVYKNKDYHVECYEKYAGPRCTQCFNVIIERPNGEFSGNWIVDGNNQYHAECYQKKLYSQWRAQNS